MTRRAAAPLQGGAEDRIARAARDVEERLEPLDLPGREELAVDAIQPVGVQPPPDLVQVVRVGDDELVPENFETIARLAAFISAKREASAA